MVCTHAEFGRREHAKVAMNWVVFPSLGRRAAARMGNRGRKAWSALPLLALALLLAACHRPSPGFDLVASVRAKRFAVGLAADAPGLSFSRRPRLVRMSIDREVRSAAITSVEPWVWRGRLPAGASLHVGVQALGLGWQVARALEVAIEVADGREREVVAMGRVGRRKELRWLDFDADLSAWGGREVTITARPALTGLLAQDRSTPLIVWGPVVLSSFEERRRDARPNVLVILIDTLRADHLTPYGYRRDTSPEIARWLGARGTRVETAYSQAPWTLPSLVAIMSGRYPGELLGPDLASFGLPPGVPSLAERFARLGYTTGAYIGNPALHAGNGFARGFQTFYSPAAVLESMYVHGDKLTERVLPWLSAHARERFFLYVHYIDPHDPYDSPENVGGRNPFDPDYRGKIGVDWIHGIYAGGLKLDDPARDLFHIKALYDSEIHFVDGQVGRVLEAIPPEVLANTLVVVTADHGEELFDHGGWKHGQTLYDEQIHVPLFFRWDGRIPAGGKLPGVVRLLDLSPTLLDAAGGTPDPAWDGVDLLPALLGKGRVPRKPAFVQHLSHGPLRAGVISDRTKLIWFNRTQPFVPVDVLQEHLYEVDMARMKPEELYDLAADPHEKSDLSAARPALGKPLAPILGGQLDEQFQGLRAVVSPCPAGSRLGGSIAFEHKPEGWFPLFLEADDRIEVAGSELRFDLACAARTKGFLVRGAIGGVTAIAARRDGAELPAGEIRIGEGAAYAGGRVGELALAARRWPMSALGNGTGPGASGALWIWRRAGAGPRTLPPSDETAKSLRALGYVQ